MRCGFVNGAVLGSNGVIVDAPRCELPARSAFAGISVPRRVRAPAPNSRSTVTAAAASCAEVSLRWRAGEAPVVIGHGLRYRVKDIPVLVDFYAAWCGPCKLVAPLMEWAASEYSGRLKVVKIDTEVHGRFVNRYGIHGLPTFAVFKNGEAFGVQEGALGKKGLQDYILTHVPELK